MAVDIGRIGIWTPSPRWEANGDELVDAARELEALGYGAVWLGMADSQLELPRKLLAATERLVVATGIINIWTNPAAEVAAAYRRVEAEYPGRILIGLGPSHKPAVERAGMKYDKPITRLAEYLDELDALDETVPADRRVLAALGPRALKLGASRTAGVHPYLTTPEHTRSARELIGGDELLAPEHKIVLKTDPATAREWGRGTLAYYLKLPNYTNSFKRLGFGDEDFEGGGSDRLVDAVIAWGETDQVVARIAEHIEAGADHVCIQALSTPTTDHSAPLPRKEWREFAQAFNATAPASR